LNIRTPTTEISATTAGKWDSHSPWEFCYLDKNLLCMECAPKYRRASSGETNQE
jgi:hypothetical protein